ncbi:MAG: hypothetical protein JXR07_08320 [Reichenbachiella sp.]
MNPRKLSVIIFVGLIVFTGIFKFHVSMFYTVPLSFLIELIGIDYQELERSLAFIANDCSVEYGLGMIFYFGTYLLLHFGLIHFLFKESFLLKRSLMIILTVSIVGLGVITVIFKFTGLMVAGTVTYALFNQLVGQPLILFLVEGGGLLYEYIDKAYLEKKNP